MMKERKRRGQQEVIGAEKHKQVEKTEAQTRQSNKEKVLQAEEKTTW